MSEIYDDKKCIITEGTITLASKIIQGQCEYCSSYTYNGYDLMNKVLCINCRDTFLERIKLIMKFQ